MPSTTVVDAWLLLGSALFGAGWGLAGVLCVLCSRSVHILHHRTGMCPGPALVNLVHPTAQGVALVAAMSVGMLLHPVVSQLVNNASETKAA